MTRPTWRLFLALATVSCTPVEWTDEVPSQLLGVWVEQSDEIAAGFEDADTIVVTRAGVRLSRYRTDGSAWSQECFPIQRASTKGHTYVLFCGPEHVDHIAATRLQFYLSEGDYAGEIGEVVGTGVNREVALISFGHFARQRIGRRAFEEGARRLGRCSRRSGVQTLPWTRPTYSRSPDRRRI